MLQNNLKITLVGDIYVGEESFALSDDIIQICQESDIVIGNLESAITNTTDSIRGKCCLKATRKAADFFENRYIDVVTLANNHIFDYGLKGYQDTIKFLEQNDIKHLGAGENIREAQKPLIISKKGFNLGFLNYSIDCFRTKRADGDSYGYSPLEESNVFSQIEELRSQVDIIFVLYHWGYCEYVLPTPEQLSLGKKTIEKGARFVIGHHSHVVQGVSKHEDGLLAYSLGNFIFSNYFFRGEKVRLSQENQEGIILQITIDEGLAFDRKIFHSHQDGTKIRLEKTPYRQKKMNKRNEIVESLNYQETWKKYVFFQFLKRILYWLNILNWRKIRPDTIKGFFRILNFMR